MKSMYEFLMESNLNDNFWKWFGESKVIDSKGNPLVVYHGSRSKHKFTSFNIKSIISKSLGSGFYFTDDVNLAKKYSVTGLFECYLRIINPFIIDWRNDEGISDSLLKGNQIGINIKPNNWIEGNDVTKILENNGYDGVVVLQPDSDYVTQHKEIVVFSPTQIKSIDNEGTWNPNDPNIYK